MEFWVAAVALTAIGCGTGIVITAMDKIFDSKKKQRSEELKLAQERLRIQELQLIEVRRQNEALQKQVEWHSKLLETQDRVVKQLTGGDSRTGDSERPLSAPSLR